MYQEYEAKMSATCDEDDWNCLRTFFDTMKAEDSKYGALNTYMNIPFYITKIDPETGNLHFYYRDYSLSRHMMGLMRKSERHALTEMYVGWLEPGTSISKFPELITKDVTNKNLHVIVRAEAEANGGFWFPSEKEVMMSAPGADLPNNETRKIIFWLHMGSPSFFNHSDYSTCYEAGYQPGMECRMMFTEDGGYIYLPYSTEETSDSDSDAKPDDQTEDQAEDKTDDAGDKTDDAEDKTDEKTDETTDPDDSDSDKSDTGTDAETDKENDQTQTDQQIVENNITNVTVTPSVIRETVYRDRYITIFKTVEEQGDKQEEKSSKQSDQTIQSETEQQKTQPTPSSSTTVDLPESGKNEKETIFPWWFIIVLIVVDALIMWFFWPKRKKTQKTSEKS